LVPEECSFFLFLRVQIHCFSSSHDYIITSSLS
jgi:hypothetical protein